MKKIITMFLSLSVIFAILTGCGATGSDTDHTTGNNTGNIVGEGAGSNNTGNTDDNISDSDTTKNSETHTEPPELTESMMVALMDILGISYEQFYSFDIEKQYAILNELGVVLEDNNEKESEKDEAPVYTTADVAKGGKYLVTIQDSMGWNRYSFYYENGNLVKIETTFQKNDEDEVSTDTYEGASLSANKYSGMTLDEIISNITEGRNNFNVYINKMN